MILVVVHINKDKIRAMHILINAFSKPDTQAAL
jgi:hypothetical protein